MKPEGGDCESHGRTSMVSVLSFEKKKKVPYATIVSVISALGMSYEIHESTSVVSISVF